MAAPATAQGRENPLLQAYLDARSSRQTNYELRQRSDSVRSMMVDPEAGPTDMLPVSSAYDRAGFGRTSLRSAHERSGERRHDEAPEWMSETESRFARERYLEPSTHRPKARQDVCEEPVRRDRVPLRPRPTGRSDPQPDMQREVGDFAAGPIALWYDPAAANPEAAENQPLAASPRRPLHRDPREDTTPGAPVQAIVDADSVPAPPSGKRQAARKAPGRATPRRTNATRAAPHSTPRSARSMRRPRTAPSSGARSASRASPADLASLRAKRAYAQNRRVIATGRKALQEARSRRARPAVAASTKPQARGPSRRRQHGPARNEATQTQAPFWTAADAASPVPLPASPALGNRVYGQEQREEAVVDVRKAYAAPHTPPVVSNLAESFASAGGAQRHGEDADDEALALDTTDPISEVDIDEAGEDDEEDAIAEDVAAQSAAASTPRRRSPGGIFPPEWAESPHLTPQRAHVRPRRAEHIGLYAVPMPPTPDETAAAAAERATLAKLARQRERAFHSQFEHTLSWTKEAAAQPPQRRLRRAVVPPPPIPGAAGGEPSKVAATAARKPPTRARVPSWSRARVLRGSPVFAHPRLPHDPALNLQPVTEYDANY